MVLRIILVKASESNGKLRSGPRKEVGGNMGGEVVHTLFNSGSHRANCVARGWTALPL